MSKHSLEKVEDFMQSTSGLEDYETTDRFGSYNCHFISYKLNSELQNLYFNSIFYWYLYLFIFIICGVSQYFKKIAAIDIIQKEAREFRI